MPLFRKYETSKTTIPTVTESYRLFYFPFCCSFIDCSVKALIDEAFHYQFYSVCVNGSRVSQAYKYIQQKKQSLPSSSHSPLIAAVLAFPLGASSVAVKRAECAHIIADGAGEIDMVINIGALKEGDYQTIFNEINAVVQTAATKNAIVKVIFETCLLKPEEIVDASILSVLAGAQFIKTSTGFSTGGATVDAVKLMRQTVGSACSVKASGGIRDKKTAFAMVEAGANRLGVSASVAIVKDGSSSSSPPSLHSSY